MYIVKYSALFHMAETHELCHMDSCRIIRNKHSITYNYHMDWLIFGNIITIVIIHAVNHSYTLSFFSININMFSLFLHILCSKRGEPSVFI